MDEPSLPDDKAKAKGMAQMIVVGPIEVQKMGIAYFSKRRMRQKM